MDNLTPAQRSYCMARVKARDTSIERVVRSDLHRRGLRFRKHVRELPGCPDIVFRRCKLVIFVDGDFWHGYRFPSWSHKLSPSWRKKIETNMKRDRRNFRKLRANGWRVVRIWQHQIEQDYDRVVDRVIKSIDDFV